MLLLALSIPRSGALLSARRQRSAIARRTIAHVIRRSHFGRLDRRRTASSRGTCVWRQRPPALPSTPSGRTTRTTLPTVAEVGRRRRARLPQPREAAEGDRRHRCCEIRPWGRAPSEPRVVSSAAAGCGERTIRRPPAVKTTGPTRLPQPVACHSSGRCAASRLLLGGSSRAMRRRRGRVGTRGWSGRMGYSHECGAPLPMSAWSQDRDQVRLTEVLIRPFFASARTVTW